MNWKLNNQIIVQGTDNFHQMLKCINQMKSYGVEVLAAISSGHPLIALEEIPIFDLVEEAIQKIGTVETSIIFASSEQVLDVCLEAIAAGIKQLIIITAKIPPLDTIKLSKIAKLNHIFILGPGSAGIIIPQKLCLGTLQPEYFSLGNVGIISYGQSLIYEVAWILNQAQMGQSLAISLGQDKIIDSSLLHWLEILNQDQATEVIIVIQTAQDIDYSSLELMSQSISKPVICYIYGSQTPKGKVFRQGVEILNNHLSHSLPDIYSFRKTISNVKKLGLTLTQNPSEIPQLIQKFL
jgi:succinyl-CoA synthetase alpha subunit